MILREKNNAAPDHFDKSLQDAIGAMEKAQTM
jgi:hypothetical protein